MARTKLSVRLEKENKIKSDNKNSCAVRKIFCNTGGIRKPGWRSGAFRKGKRISFTEENMILFDRETQFLLDKFSNKSKIFFEIYIKKLKIIKRHLKQIKNNENATEKVSQLREKYLKIDEKFLKFLSQISIYEDKIRARHNFYCEKMTEISKIKFT